MFRLLAFLFALLFTFLVLSGTHEVIAPSTYTRVPQEATFVATSTAFEPATTTASTTSVIDEISQSESNVLPPEQEKISPPDPSALEIAREKAQKSVVNILCEPEKPGGTMAVSGTGVIIDPRGVILTNAHVAQYVLLSSQDGINLACVIRTGSPATKAWKADLLYIPPEWVEEHAADIIKTQPSGTGEYDYALLLATESMNSEPVGPLPYLQIETSIDVDVVGSMIVLSAYPAEFSGLAATQQFLLSSAILTPVRNILTFNANTIDVLSFGAVALAQGGSSGGAAVNEAGNLIAIISTTSNKEFIAERDLRGITLSYINRAVTESSGKTLDTILSGSVTEQSAQFKAIEAPALAQKIINYLSQKRR